MMNHVGGQRRSRGAKLTAVNNAAIAACDGLDGITDGLIQEPRACTYSAKSMLCRAYGGPSSDANCLSPPEVGRGQQDLGRTQGCSRQQGMVWPRAGNAFERPGRDESIRHRHRSLQVLDSPEPELRLAYRDGRTTFVTDMLASIAKFNDVIGTDDNLNGFRDSGGKMITYHGLADNLIFPRGAYHYYNTVAQGNYPAAQTFYRYFPFPATVTVAGVPARKSTAIRCSRPS